MGRFLFWKETRILAALVGMGIVLGLLLTNGPPKAEFAVTPLRPDDNVLGAKDAAVQIFVYLDFECPYCKRLHLVTFPNLEKQLGPVFKRTYRNFPLPTHPKAYYEAEAAECAYIAGGSEAYYAYASQVYEETNTDNTFPESRLMEIAHEQGLGERFDDCIKNRESKSRIDRDIEDVKRMGLMITPTVIVTGPGKPIVVEGNYPAQIKAAIEAQLGG